MAAVVGSQGMAPHRCARAALVLVMSMVLTGCLGGHWTFETIGIVEATFEDGSPAPSEMELAVTWFDDPEAALSARTDSERNKLDRWYILRGDGASSAWWFHSYKQRPGMEQEGHWMYMFDATYWHFFPSLAPSYFRELFLSLSPEGVWIEAFWESETVRGCGWRQRFIVLPGEDGPEVHRVLEDDEGPRGTVRVGIARLIEEGSPERGSIPERVEVWRVPIVLEESMDGSPGEVKPGGRSGQSK